MIESIDTTTIQLTDSSQIIKGEQQSIILIQDNRKEQPKGWYEHTLLSSFFFPLLITVISALLVHRWQKRKYELEVIKLQEETKQLKDNLKPQIIASLQETQKQLLDLKLEALKQLALVRNSYFYSENFFHEGMSFLDEADDYYQAYFNNAYEANFSKFKSFIDEFEYLFPNEVIDTFNSLKKTTLELCESNQAKSSMRKMEPDEKDKKLIDRLEEEFISAISSMREDLQLDNTFIKEYLKKTSTNS